MVKITLHHNVFAQRLSVSTKIAQPHVYHQVLYLAGEGGHRLSGPRPQFSLRREVCHTSARFPLWLWLLVQASRGTGQERNSSWGENIVNKHQTSGGGLVLHGTHPYAVALSLWEGRWEGRRTPRNIYLWVHRNSHSQRHRAVRQQHIVSV